MRSTLGGPEGTESSNDHKKNHGITPIRISEKYRATARNIRDNAFLSHQNFFFFYLTVTLPDTETTS